MIMRDSVDDFPDDDIDLLSSPVTLPNGVTIHNRLAKVSGSRVTGDIFRETHCTSLHAMLTKRQRWRRVSPAVCQVGAIGSSTIAGGGEDGE